MSVSKSDASAYDKNLGRVKANFESLTPLTFLSRARDVYPDHPATIYQGETRTWRETHDRAVQLASALVKTGIDKNDTVSILAPNIPAMFEAQFGVPMSGAVLNSINTRLDAGTIAYVLEHSQSKLLITDSQFSPAVKDALKLLSNPDLIVIDIVDEHATVPGEVLGKMNYEDLLLTGDRDFQWQLPGDEWDAIALNYTSGSTGSPKGVVCSHRGAYLTSIGTVVAWPMGNNPMHMYIVPLFHCNGWCHAWALAAIGGTSVLVRDINAANMFKAIAAHRVTHFGGAPIVLSMLINATDNEKRPFDWPVHVFTAGAPPPAAVLAKIGEMGFDVTHVYGLTETYGHVVQCAWQEHWEDLEQADLASIQSRQGVRFAVTEGLMVADPETMIAVPDDGETIGEIMIRGNTVMKGYFRNEDATDEAFAGGWFHTGDLAVMHSDKYVQIKDRSKDIIISGGENISSVEIEGTLYRHPDVLAAAVVAKQHEKWGEVPCAFIELKPGTSPSEADIIAFCREHLAGFKCPKSVIFQELPKTSTGKIQKFVLRDGLKQT